MRSFPVIVLGGALFLAACGQDRQPEEAQPAAPAQEVQAPAQQAGPDDSLYADGETRVGGSCDPAAMGSVSLSIAGNPGDGFRLTKLCGTTEVARCYAEIPAAGNAATCSAGPNSQPSGDMRCVLGHKHGNSAAARAPASSCS